MSKRDSVRLDPAKLSALAIRHELARGEIAAKARVSPTTISTAFAGKRLGIKAARKIARVLGGTVAGLMLADNQEGSSA